MNVDTLRPPEELTVVEVCTLRLPDRLRLAGLKGGYALGEYEAAGEETLRIYPALRCCELGVLPPPPLGVTYTELLETLFTETSSLPKSEDSSIAMTPPPPPLL